MFGAVLDIIKSKIFLSVFGFLIMGFFIASSLGLGEQFTAGVSAFINEHLPFIKPFLQTITGFLGNISGSTTPPTK